MEAAPGPPQRLGRFVCQLLPELAQETGLTDAGFAGDCHDVRTAAGDDPAVRRF